MEDRIVELLKHAQKELNIRPDILCEGICTEEMYHMVTSGKRFFDRLTIKRLIARIGLDNAMYDNYLHYPDYCVWVKRTRIINAILENDSKRAETLLTAYFEPEKDSLGSRINIEKQFKIFMELQILRIKSQDEYEKVAKVKYLEALHYTVPNIDNVAKGKVILSPVELCMYIECVRRMSYQSMDAIWDLYVMLISYIDSALYGKFSKIKVYPKLVVCLYEDIKMYAYNNELECSKERLKQLLEWCENAFGLLREQVSLLYMTEILEMRLELLKTIYRGNEEERIAETEKYIKVLKELYSEYGVNAYMNNDAYLYRESGNFCIGETIYKRRKMKKMSAKELSEGICDVRTITREEKHKSSMQKYFFEKIFDKLKINPNYIDTGIVVNRMEQLKLYSRLRLADNAFNYNEVEKILREMERELPEHPINKQVLKRIDSFTKYKTGLIGQEEHLYALKEALSYTVDIDTLDGRIEEIFLTQEEMFIIYMMSEMHKNDENYVEAYKYIKILWDWCKELEKEELEIGRMGIYDFIMLYLSSLLGDMKRYKESNNISTKLIKMGLIYRISCSLHRYLYDQAWNNNQAQLKGYDYNKAIQRCIDLSQLNGDVNDEKFYYKNLSKNSSA